MPNFTAFLSYVLVTTFTPGPNNIMSMSNASRYGFKKSIFFNVGIFFGFIVPYYRSIFILTGFSALLALVGFIATCCWSLFGAIFQVLFVKNHKLINIIMALLLVYCAVSLFL